VANSKVPFDRDRVVKSFSGAQPAKADGRSYYRISQGPLTAAYAPTNRLLVLAGGPEASLGGVLRGEGKKATAGDLAPLIAKASAHHAWIVMAMDRLDGAVRQQVTGYMNMAAASNPGGAEAVRAYQEAKAFGMWASVSGGQVEYQVGLLCADAAKAQQAMAAMQASTQQAAQANPNDETVKNQTCSVEGLIALMSGRVSLSTLESTAEMVSKMAAMAGGGMPAGAAGGRRGPRN
jgi:hypothetical protein